VINDIDPDSPIEDLETGFRVLYPDFDEFSTDSPLSPGQLLAGDRKNTILSTLYENISGISGAVPASQILSYICSSLGQNQTANQLLSREFYIENIGRIDQIKDEIAQLGSFSNTIVLYIENDTTSDCTTEEYTGWFDIDSVQPTEIEESRTDQIEIIDLISVLCLDNPLLKKDNILREEQSWIDIDKFQTVKYQPDIGFIEEIDLRYTNSSVSKSKNTEVFEPTISETQFENPKKKYQFDTESSVTKINSNIVLSESEDKNQQNASPIIRETGLVLKEIQKFSLKRNLGSSKQKSPADIRRSVYIAKRVKI